MVLDKCISEKIPLYLDLLHPAPSTHQPKHAYTPLSQVSLISAVATYSKTE